MGILDDLRNAFDPNRNGFLNAMDPNRNGVAEALDPNRNGVAQALDPNRNGVSNFFRNSVPTFFRDSVGPVVKSIWDNFFVAPMNFMGDLFKAGSNLLSGNGLTYLLIGVGCIVVVGGIVYYNQKGKIT